MPKRWKSQTRFLISVCSRLRSEAKARRGVDPIMILPAGGACDDTSINLNVKKAGMWPNKGKIYIICYRPINRTDITKLERRLACRRKCFFNSFRRHNTTVIKLHAPEGFRKEVKSLRVFNNKANQCYGILKSSIFAHDNAAFLPLSCAETAGHELQNTRK